MTNIYELRCQHREAVQNGKNEQTINYSFDDMGFPARKVAFVIGQILINQLSSNIHLKQICCTRVLTTKTI